MNRNFLKQQKGFTLIELLVVIGILAVLLAITLIAINPARQFAQANNTKRQSDVNTILNAVDQYAADNKGALPAGITSTPTDIGFNTSGAGGSSTFVDLCSLVTKYLAAMPADPKTGNPTGSYSCPSPVTAYDTRYQISVSASDNRVTVAAPDYELSGQGALPISVTR